MGRVVWMWRGRGRDEFCSEMTDLKMHSLKKKKKRKTRKGVEGRRSSVTAMGCSQ